VSFNPAFTVLMPHTVTVQAFSNYSTAGYGTPSYSAAASTYTARVVRKQARVLSRDGAEVAGDHVAWLATTADISLRDKFTFAGSTFEILSVARYPDQHGLHHTKVTLRQGTCGSSPRGCHCSRNDWRRSRTRGP
jgi:hypothetical protein